MPKPCSRCNCNGAFPHSRPAVGFSGISLCLLCHWHVKKEAAFQLKIQRKEEQTLQLLRPGRVGDLPALGEDLPPIQLRKQQQQKQQQQKQEQEQEEKTFRSNGDVFQSPPTAVGSSSSPSYLL